MGLSSFLKSCATLLKRARKPSKNEIWLLIKMCALGIAFIGAIGFVVRLLSYLIQG